RRSALRRRRPALRGAASGIVGDHRGEGDVDALAAAEEAQLDDAGGGDDLGADAAAQLDRRGQGAAGGQQIVDDGDAASRLNRVGLDLDRVVAVFEIV